MEAPKEIYLFQSKNDGNVGVAHHKHPVETEKTTSIKYIRADLAELTWDDIKKIELLLFALECSSARPYRGEDLYKEVLRRFLENKRK